MTPTTEEKCSRCGGTGWDPEHGDHEQPDGCWACGGKGTAQAAQDRQDALDDYIDEAT